VSFRTTNSNNSLFTAAGQPKISPDGTLTYTPAKDANGNDALCGNAGKDILRGSAGGDTLTGGTEADSFDGGSGTDTATDFNTTEGDSRKNIP
jgi:Ca2+-binding RTX toxin-like protein